jgi:hypothetical protein
MNAAPNLAPTDIRACATGQAPRQTTATPARAGQHGMPALGCINGVGMARRGSKQRLPKRGPNINARNGIAGQSTAQK